MIEVKEEIEKWGRERGINNPHTQMLKFYEESGELTADFLKGRDMTDSFGDVMVTLVILADQLGYDLLACTVAAKNEIANRKGKTVNGNFIRNE